MFALLFDLMIQFLIRNDFTFTDSDMVFSHAVSVVILLKSHIYNWRKTKENVRQVNNLVGMRMKAVNANDIILPHVYAVQPYNRRSTPSINHRPSIHSRPPSNNIWVGKCYGVPPPHFLSTNTKKCLGSICVCVCLSCEFLTLANDIVCRAAVAALFYMKRRNHQNSFNSSFRVMEITRKWMQEERQFFCSTFRRLIHDYVYESQKKKLLRLN